MAALTVSECRACRVVGQCRATQQYVPCRPDDEEPLRTRIVALAPAYGRYGYRRITTLLQQEGWRVHLNRVERIWREEGLKVPQKQPQRARLWVADGSWLRRRPLSPTQVWAYDCVMERTQDGRPLKLLTVLGSKKWTPSTYDLRSGGVRWNEFRDSSIRRSSVSKRCSWSWNRS
ncbi:MAG: IS3 family transposase [Nitrospira sp.]|nr:IS3 family transposase [Nitrospira sp.]